MTIEERLVADYGLTDNPEFATWMLRDGRMVNGSIERRQRDIDHRCISEYFKRSVRESPGSAYIYVKKFMRRGNIRMSCSDFSYCAELMTVPDQRQVERLCRVMELGKAKGRQIYIERKGADGTSRSGNLIAFLDYIRRYTDLSVPERYLLLDGHYRAPDEYMSAGELWGD